MSKHTRLRALGLSHVVLAILAASAICSSSAQPASFSPRVWVYSLVATDYDGHMLLPYFLQHYRSLGIDDSQFHFDLLHDPEEPDHGLAMAMDTLGELGIDYQVVNQSYVPALQDIQMVQTLHRLSIPADDWIIVADTDELFTYGVPTVNGAIAAMEAEGATYAMGEMLDHVTRNGSLTKLQEGVSLWEQYPLLCPIISEVAKGLPAKVTMHKGYLRAGAGHHHIVDPELAKAYFGRNCFGPSCEVVMKTYKQRSTVDLYRKTPYYRFRAHYLNRRRKSRSSLETDGGSDWDAKMWSKWTKAHHFKWHSGLTENLRHRAARDSGNCILGVNEDTCVPKFQFWKEVARQYHAVSQGDFNITKLGCKEGVDTLWNWRR